MSIANYPYNGDGRHADIRAYLEMLYGPGRGYCHVVYGRDWYRNDAGKISHRVWSERIGERHAFLYPQQADAIIAKIVELDGLGADVYLASNVMRDATSRREDNVAERFCLHADADNGFLAPGDLPTIADLGWCGVGSGTPGHLHPYIPLAESVSDAQYRALQHAMVDLLEADAKKAANDVLRPPGSRNFKPTVDRGQPNPVVWAVPFSGVRLDPRAVAELLHVDLDHPRVSDAAKGAPKARAATNGQVTEPFDVSRHPQVQAAVLKNTSDRSDDTYRVMAVAYNAGLTFPQACWAVHQNPRLVERFDERKEDAEVDLLRCWIRAIDARQSQVQQLPDGNLFDGDPIPLTSLAPIPPFPVNALPSAVADMVNAVAEATQTDPAMAGTCALSVLAACNGGAAWIRIRPEWSEPLNLHMLTIAAPGERKSAVQRLMASALYEAERQLTKEGRDKRIAADTRKQVAVKAAERRRQSAAMAAAGEQAGKQVLNPAEAMDAAIAATQDAETIEVPRVPRLVADDITPEAAESLLAEQGGRLAIISAEGGIFDIIAGRYNNDKANMDLWLKGHSGDPLRVNRQGREPVDIPAPALTVGLMIQPLVLSKIAANREFRGRGLLARCLYAWPVSMVGRRRIGTPVPPEVAATYTDQLVALVKGMAIHVGGNTATLRLSSDAQAAVDALETATEPTLAPDGQLGALAAWGGKYVGAIVRIAGNLHMAAHGYPAGLRTEVAQQTIMAAARLGEYYKAGAINAFTGMGADQVTADALYLLERILAEGLEQLSERDLLTMSSRGRFKTKADLAPVVSRLIDHSYLAKVPAAPAADGRGRPGSPRYKVHPRVAEIAKIGESGISAIFAAGATGSAPKLATQTVVSPLIRSQQSTAGAADNLRGLAPIFTSNGRQPLDLDTAGTRQPWLLDHEGGDHD